MEGDLRRLGEGGAGDEADHPGVSSAGQMQALRGAEAGDVPGAGDDAQQDAAGEQRQAAQAGDDQGLDSGPAGGLALAVEADEEEGGDGSQLPEGEQGDEAVGQHEPELGAH